MLSPPEGKPHSAAAKIPITTNESIGGARIVLQNAGSIRIQAWDSGSALKDVTQVNVIGEIVIESGKLDKVAAVRPAQ